MSLLLRDEYRIVLRPDCVVLAQLQCEFFPRGPRCCVHATRVVPCSPPTDKKMPWGGALKALETVLPEFAERKSHVTVVISNHFMRYALVPWSDVLNDEAEELAYARYSFNQMYGSDANEWELRISPGEAGMPQLASAVNAGLADTLREICGRCEVSLRSIQPHLMLAYNACHASLHGQSAWLALVEHGNLCLAWLHKGQWAWIRTMRIGPHWDKALPFLLSRAALVANIETSTNDVFLWAPDSRHAPAISDGRWQIRYMQPARMPNVGSALDSRFAMYMSR